MRLECLAQALALTKIQFKGSEFSLENEVFKPFFLQQPGKTWEYFRDFIAAVAEHVSCAMCMHCGKISTISLRPLLESCECAMCVHALWENFCDFVAAIAKHVSCAMCMHCGKISAILLWPLPESCECAMCACIVGKFPRFRCGHCQACELCCVHALWENFRDFVAAIARIM